MTILRGFYDGMTAKKKIFQSVGLALSLLQSGSPPRHWLLTVSFHHREALARQRFVARSLIGDHGDHGERLHEMRLPVHRPPPTPGRRSTQGGTAVEILTYILFHQRRKSPHPPPFDIARKKPARQQRWLRHTVDVFVSASRSGALTKEGGGSDGLAAAHRGDGQTPGLLISQIVASFPRGGKSPATTRFRQRWFFG